MRIGIDAKWFHEGPPSGNVVTRNLVENLVKVNEQDDLFFFLDRSAMREPFPYPDSRVHPIYVWADNNLISNLLVLPKHAKRLSLEVVLFQNFAPPTSRFKRIAYVHDVLFLSNPEYYSLIERAYFAPLRPLCRLADGVCTVSDTERVRMITHGYVKEGHDIKVAYHGVSDIFRPAEEFSIEFQNAVRAQYQLPPAYFLYVGRLNVRKNIKNLIKALPLLRTKDIPLCIVGARNWKMDDLDELLSIREIGDRVKFLGPLHGEELACVYAMASVFCFPSFAESFGLPPLEAMKCAVPVIVSDRTSLPEICGGAGSYVNPDSPRDIASVLDSLLENPELSAMKRRLGVERAKMFTWESTAKTVLGYIHTVAARP
jgi:glycosyltransferase involved in cell wall biosynthesis